MKIQITLESIDRKQISFDPIDLPEGKSVPPYHVTRKGRIFMIDPMRWTNGSADTPIIATYVEQRSDDNINLSDFPIQKQEQAA